MSSKLPKFAVSLIINNFRNRFIRNFRWLSKQILEMFFSHVYSFFLAGNFQFRFRGTFSFTHFI